MGPSAGDIVGSMRWHAAEGAVEEVDVGSMPINSIDPRDYRFVMSLARKYNAIVFWHRDRNGIDWQPLLLPLEPRQRGPRAR